MSAPIRYPVPPEVLALDRNRHQAVEAAAGTGKTFLIEHRIAHLLLTGKATLEEILIVTFTEKATAELKRRVRDLIASILACRDHAADEGAPCWQIGDGARDRLTAALISFDRAQIFTIHGFCHRMLIESAFEGRRLLQQTQVADEAAFADAFTACLRDTLAASPALRPYLEAWLFAGRSIEELRRLLFRLTGLRGRVRPDFDEDRFAAALEAAGRLLPADEELESAVAAGGVSRRSVDKVCRNLRALSSAARELQDGSAPRALAALGGCELGYLVERLPASWSELKEAAAALAGEAVPVEAAIAARFFPEVTARLARDKARRGLFDFGDMLALCRQALEGAGGDELRRKLRGRYRYALIDEFQDTDEIQWDIFRELFVESGGRSLLTVVGDPKQAIYAFRGADVHTYLRALERLGEPLRLEVNYRSTPALCRALNLLFEHRDGDSFFSGGIRYDRPVRPGREHSLSAAGEGAGTPVHLFAVDGGSERLVTDAVKGALARRITEEIRRLLREPSCQLALEEGGTRRPLGAGDIFVLTRSAAEGEEIAESLRRAGLPCSLYKQEGLMQSAEAEEVRDLLAGIADPRDRSARLGAWQTRFFDVSLGELQGLGELDDSHPLIARLYEWKALAERRAWTELFPAIVEESRVLEREIFSSPSERSLENILHLFELLLEEALASHCELHELVQRMQSWIDDTVGWDGAGRNLQRLESERDAVQIMTIHKAKGLEAPIVFLYGGFTRGGGGREVPLSVHHRGGVRNVQVGRPESEASEAVEIEERAEDERLMYVAATRASARLYLPYVDPSAFKITGAYRPLAERLSPLLPQAEPALFSLETIPAADGRPLLPAPVPPGRAADASALLDELAPEADLGQACSAEELAALREARIGAIVTSYSREKRRAMAEASEPDRGEEIAVPGVRVPEGELPAGRESGLFLHDVLERIRFASVLETTNFDDWRRLPEVDALFGAALTRHDLAPDYLEAAERLVYRALTARLPTDRGAIPSIAECGRERREVEFLYPFQRPGGGFVRGYLDLVFEWEGRFYVLDWKSDLLADYGEEALDAHVGEHYRGQVDLYSIALARMLGEDPSDRFGGLLYLFLRGGAAWFERPSQGELRRRERALAAEVP